jgi:hypothetical protein
MKKICTILLLSGVVLASRIMPASAEDTSSGCGLGWQVSQRMSLLSSVIRTTTDTILPNTFSMTSGTSGCAKHDIVKNDENAVMFAVNNYNSIVVEMAEGRGEFLNGFAQALGCKDVSYAGFSALTQAHYQQILDQAAHDGVGLYRAVRTQLEASPTMIGQCVPTV